jgi:uncharacterized protein YjbI with pentapeptide repeats
MPTAEAFSQYATAAVALAGIPAALFGVFQFIQYRTRRDKMALVSELFTKVIEALASEVEVERLAGAILLRRFFDPTTEFGIAGLPYAQEALAVMASMLRTQPTGNLQKLLADGLAHAPTLVRADLQRTNLQKAYLGALKLGPGDQNKRIVDLSYADFYRADLSGASLRDALGESAVFYQARLNGAVLKGAKLRNANFFEADLHGAVFDRAELEGATFAAARNVPPAVAKHLNEKGVYAGPKECPSLPSAADGERPRIFLSRPGWSDEINAKQIAAVCSRLEREGFEPVMLARSDYPVAGALAEAKRLIAGCAGAVILGFRDIRVATGAWRPGTPEETELKEKSFATMWSQVEAGMAVMAGLPVLVIGDDDVDGGVFDAATSEHGLVRIRMDMTSPHLSDWCAAAGECARQR